MTDGAKAPTMAQVEIVYDLGEAEGLAEDIIVSCQDNNVPPDKARVGIALALGYLMTPKDLDDDAKTSAIAAILQHAGLYFMEGNTN